MRCSNGSMRPERRLTSTTRHRRCGREDDLDLDKASLEIRASADLLLEGYSSKFR